MTMKIIPLVIAGISFYIVLSWLLSVKQKNFKVHLLLEKNKEKRLKKGKGNKKTEEYIESSFFDLFFNIKPLRKFAPSLILREAQKVEWELSYFTYQIIIVVSGSILSGFLYIYFNKSLFSLIGFVLAFATPRIILHYKRKKYIYNQNDRLSVYMKTLANSISVLGNVVDSLNDTIKLVHPTLREDLQKAVSLLQAGKQITEAFKEFCEKYDYKDIVFFHEMLEVTHESGGEYTDILLNIAEDYEHRKYLQSKLNGAMAQAKQAYVINSIIFLLLPLIFYFLQRQAYVFLMSSISGPIVIIVFVALLLFAFWKIEKMSSLENFKNL